jgi:hypothetical protein
MGGTMRQIKLFAVMAFVVTLALSTGCQSISSPFNSKREPNRRAPDPLTTNDLDEQQRFGRSRYSYIEDDRGISPPGYIGRPTPGGR